MTFFAIYELGAMEKIRKDYALSFLKNKIQITSSCSPMPWLTNVIFFLSFAVIIQ